MCDLKVWNAYVHSMSLYIIEIFIREEKNWKYTQSDNN